MNSEITGIKVEDLPEIYEINKISNLTYWSLDQFKTEFNQKSDFNFKISEDKNILGFIFSSFILGDLSINNICILPDFQRNGFGSFLLHYSLNEARKRNTKNVYLEVRFNNLKAIKFYEKFGFSTNYIRKNYYSNGEDAVLMSLELSLLHQ